MTIITNFNTITNSLPFSFTSAKDIKKSGSSLDKLLVLIQNNQDINTTIQPDYKIHDNIIVSKGINGAYLALLILTGGKILSHNTSRAMNIPIVHKALDESAAVENSLGNKFTNEYVFSTELSNESAIDSGNFYSRSTFISEMYVNPKDFALKEDYDNIINAKRDINKCAEKTFTDIKKLHEVLIQNPELKDLFKNLSKTGVILYGRPVGKFNNVKDETDPEACYNSGMISNEIVVSGVICKDRDKQTVLSVLQQLPFAINLVSTTDFSLLSNNLDALAKEDTKSICKSWSIIE